MACFRDNLIAMLQQQIDDLSLAVEEEKLNHKDSKRLASISSLISEPITSL